MSGYAQELTDIRTLLDGAASDPDNIAWPGEPYDPPQPTGQRGSAVSWWDVEIVNPSSEQLDFGGNRRRFLFLDVAICHELGAGADALCRADADTLETHFTGADTSTMTYFVREATLGDGEVWQGAWWRRDWRLPIWSER